MRTFSVLYSIFAGGIFIAGSVIAFAATPQTMSTSSVTVSPMPTDVEVTAFYVPNITKIDRAAGDDNNPFKKAMIELSSERYRAAGVTFTSALLLHPRFIDANFNRGLASEGLKKWDFVIVDFSTVIRWRPRFYDAYIERARSYQRMGDIARSRVDAEAAKAIHPDRPDAYKIRPLSEVLHLGCTMFVCSTPMCNTFVLLSSSV